MITMCEKLSAAIDHSSIIDAVQYFDIIDSTNSYALNMIKDGCLSSNLLIYANQQSRGRGRREKSWLSPAGGIYFSIVIKGKYPPFFSLVAGLSLSETIDSELNKKTSIKWPNDIYLNEKKIAGILIETSSDNSVIGIGINTAKDAEITLETAATIGEISDDMKINLIKKFLDTFEKYLPLLSESGFSSMRDRVMNRLLYLNQSVSIDIGDTTFTGILKGISDLGEIMLLIGDRISFFNSGSLRVGSTRVE